MKRERFVKVVEEPLDSLPQEFRSRIQNVAALVEDVSPNQRSLKPGQQGRMLLAAFQVQKGKFTLKRVVTLALRS